MNPLLSDYLALSNIHPVLFAIVLIWSLVWKGLALWKAARKNSKGWFLAILIINTIGIFEILYIFLFSEIKLDAKDKARKTSKKQSKSNLRNRKSLLE